MEPGTAASWQTDPTGRHEHRYWDGERWTDTVSDGGATSIDAYAPPDTASTSPAATPAAAPDPTVAAPPAASAPTPEPVAPAPSPAPAPVPEDAGPSRRSAAAKSATGVSTIVAGALAIVAVIVIVLILTNL